MAMSPKNISALTKDENRTKGSRKKTRTGTIVLWLVMFGLLGAGIAEFAGPWKGWLETAVVRTKDWVVFAAAAEELAEMAEEKAESTAAGNPRLGSLAEKAAKIPEAAPGREALRIDIPGGTAQRDRRQQLYRQFFQEEMSQLSAPQIGRKYTLSLTDNRRVEGALMVLGRHQAVVKTREGDQTVTLNMLTVQSMKVLFPRQYARQQARRRLDQVMAQDGAGKEDAAGKAIKSLAAAGDHSSDNHLSAEPQLAQEPKVSPLTKYDPTESKTPKKLSEPVTMFGQWLKYQSRRVGPLATKIYAKQHGRQVALYMVMHPNYSRQKLVARELYCEQFWRMWARRCREARKVRSLKRAHVVLLNQHGKIIGGSRVKDASDTWVKR